MTQVAKAEVSITEWLVSAYGIRGVTCSVVPGVNWTFAVDTETDGQFYARLYRATGRSESDIAAELSAIQAIKDTAELGVTRPVCDREGLLVSDVTLEGASPRRAVVFEAAKGLLKIGRALRALHSQEIKVAAARQLGDFSDVDPTLEMIAAHPVGLQFAVALKDGISTLRNVGASVVETPMGFCHGDFRDANLLIDGNRVNLFDFDDCGVGPLWLDLATMGWWLELSDDKEARQLWLALIDGYGAPVDKAAFDLSIRWLVAVQHLRSLRFLLDYTVLDEDLWAETFASAATIIERAACGTLRIHGRGKPSSA